MLTIEDRQIDFVESGEGPPVLFVPGSFGAPAAWRGIQKLLPKNYRFVATSICGYGNTTETRSLDDLGMDHQLRILQAVADKIREPFHLVGHSFGGAIALASALPATLDILSIATFEANPLGMIAQGGNDALFDETREMSQAFETAHLDGERDAAARIIDYWGGAGSFAAMPGVVQDYCRDRSFSNVLDWRTAYTFKATPADYARLPMPVLLVRGSLANDAMVSITNALATSVPNAQTAVVDGASHFLISTHPQECAGLLGNFLAEVGRPK